MSGKTAQQSRIERARARARGAKAVIASGTLLVFGVAFVGAKVNAPGHTKGKAQPLDAPKAFKRAVKRSVAQGGQIQPAIAPPPVSTATS
jgi:hypothetical protein